MVSDIDQSVCVTSNKKIWIHCVTITEDAEDAFDAANIQITDSHINL